MNLIINNYLKDYLNRPLNKAFKDTRIGQIQSKILSNGYDGNMEWYQEIVSMYESFMANEPDQSINYTIAKYLLEQFKKEIKTIVYTDIRDWSSAVQYHMEKFSSIISHNPAPQGIDDLVYGSIKRCENLPQLTPHEIADMVSKLEAMINDTEKRRCILAILKKTQKDLHISKESEHIVIDFEKLTQTSLNALNNYVRAYD